MRKRRVAALWLLLFAVYASTLGMHAFGRSDYGGDEPHYLLTAKSLVEDGNPDLRDEYAQHAYREFYPYVLTPHGSLTSGRAHEPHGVGLPLLIAPADAIAGAKGVEVFLAMIAALAIVLAYMLALRVVPDPWALGATLAVGLSPPIVAYSTAVYPELPAAAALCGALLLALRIPLSPRRRVGWSSMGLVALLPWLGTKYLIPGLVVAVYAYRAMRAERRPVLAITCVEIVGFSAALYVGVNEGLYGGPTPYSAATPGETATDASFPFGYLERAYRLVALFVDRHYGLLRWAPIFALGLYGAWILWRERRSGLVRAIPALRAEQTAGQLCAAVAGAQLLVAAFLAPTMFGFWFPGRHLVAALPVAVPLVAIGLRRHPRLGAVLAAVGIASSVWVYLAVRLGDARWIAGLPDAPLGPLTSLLPRFAPGTTYPFVLASVVGLAVAALFASSELRRSRRAPAG
jgi:hypothetical protein